MSETIKAHAILLMYNSFVQLFMLLIVCMSNFYFIPAKKDKMSSVNKIVFSSLIGMVKNICIKLIRKKDKLILSNPLIKGILHVIKYSTLKSFFSWHKQTMDQLWVKKCTMWSLSSWMRMEGSQV